MAQTLDIACDLISRAKAVHEQGDDAFHVWSTGERLAVALVLNRPDLLKTVNGGYTIVEAIDRVGDEWMRAVMIAHKHIR